MAKRRTVKRRVSTAARRSTRRAKGKNRLANFFVPLFFMFCILFCLGFLTLVGYRTATASSFFDLQAVAIRGVSRASRSEIEKIVKTNSVRTGVWNADLGLMKKEIEGLKFVKTVSVSRVLPNKFRVIINERIPKATVRLDGKDFWVDEDARILSRVSNKKKGSDFIMFGWDRSKTEGAFESNKKRVNLYSSLKKEWKEFNLSSRVKAVDLSDLKDPKAIVADSGEIVTIYLGKKDFGKSLKWGLENIAGRGKEVESIIVGGQRPILGFRNL